MSTGSPVSIIFEHPVADVYDMLADLLKGAKDVHPDGDNYCRDGEIHLLFEGLAFVLVARPLSDNDRKLQRIFFSGSFETVQSALDVRLGNNLEGGLRVPALALGYLQFVAKLAGRLHAVGVAANDAGVVSDASYFIESVEAFAQGGPFPALALVGLAATPDGGSMQTRGLMLFAAQEILFRSRELERTDIAKRLVRLVHDIACNGPILEAQDIDDMRKDMYVALEPVENGRLLVATVHSGADKDFV